MLDIPSILLIVAISAGQLIKIPFGTYGGLTLLDLSLIMLSVYGVLKVKPDFKNIPSWIKFAFVFMVFATISLILTPLKLTSFEVVISFSYMVRFFLYIFFALLVIWGVYPEIKNNIYKIFIYSGIILALLGLNQLIFLPDLSALTTAGWDPHYFRTVATFLDPNFFGAFMILILLLIIRLKNTKLRVIFFLLVFTSLLTTFSRGAYLGFAVAFLTFSILNKSIKLLILTIYLSVILILSFMIYQNTVAAPRNIDRTQSAQYRVNSYQHGLTIFQNNPLLGIGFNAYRFAIRDYSLADEQFLQSHGSSTNDSSLLYVAATTGLIGTGAYLSFLFSLIWIGWKKNSILISGLIGLIAQSFFANTLFYPFLLIWLILIIIKKDYF